MKLLGIDYGDSKVGLAFGDIESGVATPYGVIRNLGSNNLVDEIKKICDKERIGKIVIGIPVNPMSLDSPQIRKVENFIAKLKEATGLEVEGRDERFSTQEAQKLISKSKSKDDDISAMLILQNYFDFLSK